MTCRLSRFTHLSTEISDLSSDTSREIKDLSSYTSSELSREISDLSSETVRDFAAAYDTLQYTSIWRLGSSGSSAYTFTGSGNLNVALNPTIYLVRGEKYRFDNRSGGHPFQIQSTEGIGGNAYNDGVTNNAGGNNTDIIIDVPFDSPSTLYYQCTAHSNMKGKLIVNDKKNEEDIQDLSSLTFHTLSTEISDLSSDTSREIKDLSSYTSSELSREISDLSSETVRDFAAAYDTLQYTSIWNVGSSGSSAYTFTGSGNLTGTQNPTIYLVRGEKYRFDNRSGGHPFQIQSTEGIGGNAYSDGCNE